MRIYVSVDTRKFLSLSLSSEGLNIHIYILVSPTREKKRQPRLILVVWVNHQTVCPLVNLWCVPDTQSELIHRAHRDKRTVRVNAPLWLCRHALNSIYGCLYRETRLWCRLLIDCAPRWNVQIKGVYSGKQLTHIYNNIWVVMHFFARSMLRFYNCLTT